MLEYFQLVFRSIFFYSIIVFALRVMGKREVGELSILDIVIYFVQSEILAMAIASPDEPLLKPLLAITTLVLLQILVAWTCLKKKWWRDFFEGKPSYIIENGIINQSEMRKQRYSIDDLLYQLRDKDISSVDEVDFAILENSGVLTVLKKNDNKLKYPQPLIADGIIQKEVLANSNLSEDWLKKELLHQGCEVVQEVFLCLYQKNGLYVIKKQNTKTMTKMK